MQTRYGRRHGFSSIASYEDYQRQVPLVSYDEMSEWMHRVQDGEEDVLFRGRAIAFEMTGGSSGGSKLIPYSRESFTDFRKAIVPWLSDIVECYNIDSGSAYFAISPVCREPLVVGSGIPVGMPDGAYLGEDALQLLATLSAVPGWVACIDNVVEWKHATLYYLIQRRDLALVSVWSPTFFIMLLDAIEECASTLLSLYQHGGQLPQASVKPDHESHQRLRNYLQEGITAILWPELKLVSCWADASSRPYYLALKQRIPHAQFQAKGLLATEGVMTVPDMKGEPCLAVDSGFYEFIDDKGSLHLCHELIEGRQYELVITTAGGLYRYRTGDQVIYHGFSGGLPVLRFAGRSGLISDMVGEKLSDEFVTQCLDGISGFRMLVPLTRPAPYYVLLTDCSAGVLAKAEVDAVEERLFTNPQYAYARRIGQLGALKNLALEAPLENFVKIRLAGGSRLGDIKIPALGCLASWVSYVEAML